MHAAHATDAVEVEIFAHTVVTTSLGREPSTATHYGTERAGTPSAQDQLTLRNYSTQSSKPTAGSAELAELRQHHLN
jgi:hypothetical protein